MFLEGCSHAFVLNALMGVSLDPATGDVGIGTIASIRGGITLLIGAG